MCEKKWLEELLEKTRLFLSDLLIEIYENPKMQMR